MGFIRKITGNKKPASTALAGLSGFHKVYMNNYNFIQTSVNDSGRLARFYSPLQRLLFKNKPHLKPTPSNLIKPLMKGHPEHIQQVLDDRRYELLPGLLKPFAEKRSIFKQADRIADDIRKHVNAEVNVERIWEDFCRLWNLGNLKQPRADKLCTRHNWMIILRRLARRASYLYDAITKPTGQYVSDRYLRYSLSMRPSRKYITDSGEVWTYNRARLYKQFCRASCHMVKSRGIGELAVNRGLSPLAVVITPLPKYSMHSSSWQGSTPEQTSAAMMLVFRRFTDKLRHSGVDSEIIRVTEPQKSGTPHIHLLLFVDEQFIDMIQAALQWAFVDGCNDKNIEAICGADGIDVKRCYDWEGELKYVTKDQWGGLKSKRDYESEIMAWAENGCHRRFSTVSTMHKYPSNKFWEQARKGRAEVEVYYKERLRDDVKTDASRIEQINMQLNEAAKSNNYADFCRAYWAATGTDEVIERNRPRNLDIAELAGFSQLRVDNRDNYLSDILEAVFDHERVPVSSDPWVETAELVLDDTS